MRTIGVVTVARSDYGILLPVMRRIKEEPGLNLHLIVSGMHLSPEFGFTVRAIEEDGFEIGDRVEMLLSSDTPESISKSMGLGIIGYAQSYARIRPDILLVMGDRFEMHAGALAALPFKIPVAHIHGGELTEGAIDDALRHSITKLSHLHFVATKEYRDRVIQLGEEPWRVSVSGAPSLDNLRSLDLMDAGGLESKFGLNLATPPLLVTFHPVTLEYQDTEWQVKELLAALEASKMPVVITQPNADTSGRTVTLMLRDYAESHSNVQVVDNLGTHGYFSLMTQATAMVGNSSSGIIEAPSFHLPVVNIGIRQKGRVRGSNVIDVGYNREQVLEGIRKTQDPQFRKKVQESVNPYDHGDASGSIVKRLIDVELNETLVRKSFHQVP